MMTEVYLTPLQYTVHILYILILSFNQNQMMTEVYLTPLQYTVHILYILILSFNLIRYKTIHCIVYVVESIVLICDSMVYYGIWD